MNVQVAVEASTTNNTQNQGSIEIYIKHFIFYKVPIIINKVSRVINASLFKSPEGL